MVAAGITVGLHSVRITIRRGIHVCATIIMIGHALVVVPRVNLNASVCTLRYSKPIVAAGITVGLHSVRITIRLGLHVCANWESGLESS
jgi:uncharacterized membrane protein YjjP (DUF1212 family)